MMGCDDIEKKKGKEREKSKRGSFMSVGRKKGKTMTKGSITGGSEMDRYCRCCCYSFNL